jgi:2-polyprenyl-3-methyl-5-hydroxy-6-metoxy-1,4-benzoquinol methylase
MSSLWTEDPRLAAVYDTECAGRADHDFYLALADELGARSVVDLGCGKGVFAVDLAQRGHAVVGVDPAGPMLEIARHRSAGLAVE